MTYAAPSRFRATFVVALIVATLVTAVGLEVAGADGDLIPVGPGDVTIQIDIEHSRFLPERLTVVEGTRVRFLVVNGDPIHHEFITGGPEIHLRHANGTETQHPSTPGEVTVDPGQRAMTTYTFDEVGRFEFACHLPRHYQYGMKGEIVVVPSLTG